MFLEKVFDILDFRHSLIEVKNIEDARFAPKALQAMREAYVEMPSQSLKDMILRFRAKFSL